MFEQQQLILNRITGYSQLDLDAYNLCLFGGTLANEIDLFCFSYLQ